ncbi:hypothetical protein EON81_05155 [bacterium]|nr:MAG: hypothetical protein EON81_05155 [bacterium]
MLGALLTLLAAAGAAGVGRFLIGRATDGLPEDARLGLHGLVGLGALGFLCLPLGLIPGGFGWGPWVVLVVALAGLAQLIVKRPTFEKGEANGLLFKVAIGLAVTLSVIGALAPADSIEWDSLAYHLAVPKMWLAEGRMTYVPFIHHSNFPLSVDGLFVWGMAWGGEIGAKLFSPAFFLYGLLAIGGLARHRYGGAAGRWAALAYAATPLAIWLSGTAYIDVAHGLFAGLGLVLLFLAPERWLAAGALIGLAAGSKYTGLQTILVAGLVAIPFAGRVNLRPALLALVLAGAVSAPWYVRNIVNTGNPVFPFFYSVLKGRDWSDFNAKIYSHEQQTFGAGRPSVPAGEDYVANGLDPTRIGGSALGLAYQPGRYINPNPVAGQGFPIGAIGAVGLVAALWWAFSGRAGTFEKRILAAIGISLLLWFGLSQQSRYILSLAPLMAILAGGAVVQLRALGVAALAGVQLVVAIGVQWMYVAQGQLPAVIGKIGREEWRAERVGFARMAPMINQEAKGGRVALYDEVFGYVLDVPYYWANPGHTTELGYEGMHSGDDLVAALKSKGITHVYFNLGPDREAASRWIEAAQGTRPFEGEERTGLESNLEIAWKLWLSQAAASGKLRLLQATGSKLFFKVE